MEGEDQAEATAGTLPTGSDVAQALQGRSLDGHGGSQYQWHRGHDGTQDQLRRRQGGQAPLAPAPVSEEVTGGASLRQGLAAAGVVAGGPRQEAAMGDVVGSTPKEVALGAEGHTHCKGNDEVEVGNLREAGVGVAGGSHGEELPGGIPAHHHLRFSTVPLLFPSSWSLHSWHGPAGFVHPTEIQHRVEGLGVMAMSTSRRTRKGRGPVVLPHHPALGIHHVRPKGGLHLWGYRLWGFEWESIHWWVAQLFTWGSVVWTVNGCFAMWPLSDGVAQLYAVGYTALAGGSLFLVGASLAYLEWVNAESDIDFPHEIHSDLEALKAWVVHPGAELADAVEDRLSNSGAAHHVPLLKRREEQERGLGDRADGPEDRVDGLKDRAGGLGDGAGGLGDRAGLQADSGKEGCSGDGGAAAPGQSKRRRWFGWEPRSVGFWCVFSQLLGATIFAIPACITGVPHVLPTDYPPCCYITWDLLYWLPQCIGASFFVISSYLQVVEVQGHWLTNWKPLDLGWQAGFWNLIGAVGFFLSGLFGFFEYPADKYQYWGTAFSTFWGSIAFLVSSYLLLPEMLNK